MDKRDNNFRDDFSKIEQEIKEKKKLPKKDKEKLIKYTIINLICFIAIVFFLILIYITEENLPTENFIGILKIVSILLCIISMILLEISFKTNNNLIIIKTIEIIIVMFFTIFLISAYSLYYGQFYKIILISSVIVTIYYLMRFIIYYRKTKKIYYKNLNDIKTIVAR